jgi:hypothetical protein
MNPTVTGALIGGGAAIVGFVASAWNTARTVRSNREAAREQRLWDKRSALYEALLRDVESLRNRPGNLSTPAQDMSASLQASAPLVHAYASDVVLNRYDDLTSQMRNAGAAFFSLREPSGGEPLGAPRRGGPSALDRDVAVAGLILAIRDELQMRRQPKQKVLVRALVNRYYSVMLSVMSVMLRLLVRRSRSARKRS